MYELIISRCMVQFQILQWAVPVNKCTGGWMKTRGCPGGGGGFNMDVQGGGGGGVRLSEADCIS